MFSLKQNGLLKKKKIHPTWFFTCCPSNFEPRVKKQQGKRCVSKWEFWRAASSWRRCLSASAAECLPRSPGLSRLPGSRAQEKPKLKRGGCATGVTVTRPCKETVLVHLVIFMFCPLLEQKEPQLVETRDTLILESSKGFTDLGCLPPILWQNAASVTSPKSASEQAVLCQRWVAAARSPALRDLGWVLRHVTTRVASQIYLLVRVACSVVGNESCSWRRQGQSLYQHVNYSSGICYTRVFLPGDRFRGGLHERSSWVLSRWTESAPAGRGRAASGVKRVWLQLWKEGDKQQDAARSLAITATTVTIQEL